MLCGNLSVFDYERAHTVAVDDDTCKRGSSYGPLEHRFAVVDHCRVDFFAGIEVYQVGCEPFEIVGGNFGGYGVVSGS